MENATNPIAISHPHTQPAPSASNLLHSLMRYKFWADTELLNTVLALPELAPTLEGTYVTAIIRHFHTVDCIFKAHLLGVPHRFTSPNPPEPATLAELQPLVAAVDTWFVEYARQLAPRDICEPVRVRFTDGQEQVLTRAEILLHISQHGGGHRAQVSLLLQKLGATPPPDRFTNYLRQHDERRST